jgi:hypothetical protein
MLRSDVTVIGTRVVVLSETWHKADLTVTLVLRLFDMERPASARLDR